MGTKDNSNDAAHFKEIYEHLNVDYPLAVYFVRPEEYFLNNIPWHWHEEIEIDIVREGNAIYTVGEQSLMVPYNHAILIKGNTGHSIKSVQGQNCTIMSVILSPKLLFSDSSSMRSAYESPFYYNEKVILISPSDRIGKTLISYLEDIIDYNLNKSYGYDLLTKSALYQFW